MKTLATGILAAALLLLAAVPAGANELKLLIRDGRVTLEATNVPVGRILEEWSRVGRTKIVNGERVPGAPLTLRLVDVPERQALDIILRAAAGYVAAPRAEPVEAASLYDRILVLATSVASAAPPPPAPTAVRPGFFPQPDGFPEPDGFPDPDPFPQPADGEALGIPQPGDPEWEEEFGDGSEVQTPPFPPRQFPRLQPQVQPMPMTPDAMQEVELPPDFPAPQGFGVGPGRGMTRPGAAPPTLPPGASPVPGVVVPPPQQEDSPPQP